LLAAFNQSSPVVTSVVVPLGQITLMCWLGISSIPR
jgi:hypothetical protein